ncbi:hypothetical protein ACFLT2_08150 [Acidobacteriota bacterium]
MKVKKAAVSIIVIFFMLSLCTLAETKKLREIGRFKFAQIEDIVPADEAMKILVDRYSDDIEKGFGMAGYSDVFHPFMEQVRQSVFEEKQLAVGEKMEWMLFRSQGAIKLVQDLEWAGADPLPAISFTVLSDNKKYEFIMPKTCGNISLVKVEEYAATSQEPPFEEQEESLDEIQKAKIYQDIYPLLTDTDLYCSIFIMDNAPPEMMIIGAERGWERTLITDGETVYVNKGRDDGLETGQLFLVFEVGEVVKGFGPVGIKRGRARIVDLENRSSSAKLEKACGAISKGHYLVPFEEKESRLGKDLGHNVPPHRVEGLHAEIVYLETDFNQIGTGYFGIINAGEEQGVQVGQQLIVFREEEKGAPLYVFGNVVVIDTQNNTSTIKVLSCRDALRYGDEIQTRPSQ